MEKKGLGRGLSALLADISPPAEPPVAADDRPAAPTSPARTVPIDRIRPNPDQPRRSFDEKELNELAASIRERGVIQPLLLRPYPGSPQEFQIVAGERRWRAAQIANIHDLPAIVRDLNDTEVLELAIIENIQRADLNAVEEALGYRQLMDRFGHTQERLAEALLVGEPVGREIEPLEDDLPGELARRAAEGTWGVTPSDVPDRAASIAQVFATQNRQLATAA